MIGLLVAELGRHNVDFAGAREGHRDGHDGGEQRRASPIC
jgi:hypothetical protein